MTRGKRRGGGESRAKGRTNHNTHHDDDNLKVDNVVLVHVSRCEVVLDVCLEVFVCPVR
jgi:hypothetical protein